MGLATCGDCGRQHHCSCKGLPATTKQLELKRYQEMALRAAVLLRVPATQLWSRQRDMQTTTARQIVAYLLRQVCGCSFPQAGEV